MRPITVSKSYESSIAVNRTLKNTYLLLSLTLLFSATTAYIAIITKAPAIGILLLLIGMFGLYFLTLSLRNSPWGVLAIFLYTGFMGYTLGPVINSFIHASNNGPQIFMTALGATGLIFLGLSSYVLISKKDFSYMGGFLAGAVMIAFFAGIGSIFFKMPVLNILISGAFALISSGFILYTTSQLISGGERNYIMATISLYIVIFNLFISLLRLLSFFTGGGSRN